MMSKILTKRESEKTSENGCVNRIVRSFCFSMRAIFKSDPLTQGSRARFRLLFHPALRRAFSAPGARFILTQIPEGSVRMQPFRSPNLHHIFNASYRNGWGRIGAAARVKSQPGLPQTGRDVPGGGIQQGLGGAATAPLFAAEFPADRPIRSKQYAFPQIVEPAFHYRNPATGRMPSELLP
jgi:hypothetical protein